LREDADYHGEFSTEGAETVLRIAEEFLNKAELLVKARGNTKK